MDITHDDLQRFAGQGPAFVTLGEVMVRDTPADGERLERTRQVWVALAGSEFNVAVMLSRLGVPSSFVTRTPDNPYGWLLRNVAREQGLDVSHIVWAERGELMGHLLYELGRTPRPGAAWYQRQHSAASKLGAGMVDWSGALRGARLLHTSGINFGLSAHSGYACNHLLDAFHEALAARPAGCRVGFDLNYRSTLWSLEQCRATLTPLLAEHVDILITSVEDMAQFYGLGWGPHPAAEVAAGQAGRPDDEGLKGLLHAVMERFALQIVAVTMRSADSQEEQRWESAAMDAEGHYFRSPAMGSMAILDRLGGGDAWTGGFYYGLLTEDDPACALAKGVSVGDAATRLQQTIMYDLPLITRQEINALLTADARGGSARVLR
jgi:2-dehydro-3-deoxygluconokinase